MRTTELLRTTGGRNVAGRSTVDGRVQPRDTAAWARRYREGSCRPPELQSHPSGGVG
jgi:hypothetical protein